MSSLVERLGHDADARVLIVNCDDLGLCHAANEGVYDALHNGLATSASLMVPAPWAREA
ncbi:MAG: ChbG/HpnK family deacetylase, partial [Acidobacteria bacterium]|nr:ChbG/HpnK family deacetylase [Acidobacteriota bacterium]